MTALSERFQLTDTIRLRNRFVATAHASGAVADGLPIAGDAEYWQRLAQGGAAMAIIGGSVVSLDSFVRRGKQPDDLMLVVLNATPVPRMGYRIGVPRPGFYQEVLNTDAGMYGGSNLGNMGGIHTEDVRHMGRDHSLRC